MECANKWPKMDSAGSDRPQRRIALVGRELDRYKVEVAGLSETRRAEEGLLKEVSADYAFFWCGRKKEERREAGAGFAIKSHLVSKLSELPKGINGRLMMLRLLLSSKRHATIVSAYAPILTNLDAVKKFFDDLDSVSATPRTDKLILLGDINARVGTYHQISEGVIRTERVGKCKCNSNGLLLLRKRAEHELLINNTVFQIATRHHGCTLALNTGITLIRITKKYRDSLKRNTKNTRQTSVIPAQYLVTMPIQTYERQSRLGSETYKTPD